MRKGAVDPNPEYWSEYTNFQHVKHEVIKRYLDGWFPKLGYWSGRVIYFDTHAGRGKHASGELGSPLVALRTFMNHSHRETILKKSEVIFAFIERNEENHQQLKAEIKAFEGEVGGLPRQVRVLTEAGDFECLLCELLDSLEKEKKRLAPPLSSLTHMDSNSPVHSCAGL